MQRGAPCRCIRLPPHRPPCGRGMLRPWSSRPVRHTRRSRVADPQGSGRRAGPSVQEPTVDGVFSARPLAGRWVAANQTGFEPAHSVDNPAQPCCPGRGTPCRCRPTAFPADLSPARFWPWFSRSVGVTLISVWMLPLRELRRGPAGVRTRIPMMLRMLRG
jgi:hypothetical protein